jgi:hypothetical protein
MGNDPVSRAWGKKLRFMILGFILALSACLVAITLALFGQVRTVRADTLCVRPGGAGGCFASIQSALSAAGAGDLIRVAHGSYFENVAISKTVTLQGGWAPDFSIRDTTQFSSTILPADNTKSVVSIQGQFGDPSAVAPTLDGFVITGGRADLGSNHGGGLSIRDSNALVISNTIKNNVAFLLGGGVWVQRGAPVLQGNQIMDNQSIGLGQDAHGGGVQLENTQAALIDNLILGNIISGTQVYGGGVEVSGSGAGLVVLRRNRFISNTATTGSNSLGGAIAVLSGQALMEDSIVISNTAVTGGGIFIGGSLTGQSNLIQGNRALQGGGGFLINATGSISLTNSAAIANLAGGDGGAILNSGVISISNVTVSGNTAGGMGGGIANLNLVNLSSATVSDNASADGAGLFNANTLITLNSLIALNHGDNCLGGLFSLGHNLEDGGTCALGHTTDLSNTASSLGPLREYGSLALAHPLAADSPAIDAGDNAACAPFDQRGVSRPIDGDGDGQAVCDIGAYEYQLPLYLPVILRN